MIRSEHDPAELMAHYDSRGKELIGLSMIFWMESKRALCLDSQFQRSESYAGNRFEVYVRRSKK
jgi:hypothetical protein